MVIAAPRSGPPLAAPVVRAPLPGRRPIAVAGAAIAVITAWDGSPLWQGARLAGAAAVTVLCAWGLGRVSRSTGAWMAFAAGWLGFAVGVGIGVPHVAKAGLHPLTVAGLVAAAAGLVLLGTSGAALVRRARPVLRVPVVAALVVLAGVGLLTVGQAVAATNVPRTSLGSLTPADRGLVYRRVTFATSDGVTLSGWYIPTRNGAAVVLLHGAGSTRSAVLDHAVALARHGYGVLLFDARGHGRSGGRAMDFGWDGDRDVGAGVSFLLRQAGVVENGIAAVGMSMGGEEAIGAAAADPRIRAVVAEGATGRVPADKAWLSRAFGWRGALQERLEWVTYHVADVLTRAHEPVGLREAVGAAAPRRFLLITAGSRPDEGRAARHIRSGSPAAVEIWTVPRGSHTGGLAARPHEWDRRVHAFLVDALGIERVHAAP